MTIVKWYVVGLHEGESKEKGYKQVSTPPDRVALGHPLTMQQNASGFTLPLGRGKKEQRTWLPSMASQLHLQVRIDSNFFQGIAIMLEHILLYT